MPDGVEGLDKALPAALFGSVDRYSKSPKLDTLAAWEDRELLLAGV